MTYAPLDSPTQHGDNWTIPNPFSQAFVNTTSNVAKTLTGKFATVANNFNNTVNDISKKVKDVKQGYRTGTSYDTGVTGDNATRYNAIKQEVIDRKINPSINQLKKHWYCSAVTAKAYLEHMAKEGVIIKDDVTGQYSLI